VQESIFNRKEQIVALDQNDVRVKRLAGIMNRHRRQEHALIEILHVVQDLFGYIPLEVMNFIAKEMKMTPSKIYGVVTFYHFFMLKPKGEHNCFICTGTACHVKGAQALVDKIKSDMLLSPGDTTEDGKLGVQAARCLGCCGLAPAVVIDNEIKAKVTPEALVKELKEIIGADQ